MALGRPPGPNADGTLSAKLKSPPPGLRRAGCREVLGVLSRPEQVRYPATANADASLGFCVTGDQSAALAPQTCYPQRSLLVRLEGQATRGHQAGKKEPAQRGKVGYCPCCAALAHTAAPPPYEMGPFEPLKARGMRLQAKNGP